MDVAECPAARHSRTSSHEIPKCSVIEAEVVVCPPPNGRYPAIQDADNVFLPNQEGLMTATENIRSLRIRLAFCALGAVLGFSQAWTSRLDAEDNTVSYLDMGSYFFHGHHWSIINGFWSPLYALLLSLPVTVLKPSMYWEYPTVHLVVFLIFLFTIACFDYFLRQLMQFRSEAETEKKDSSELDWVWIATGYTIFFWSSLQLIGVDRITPDMLVAGFFFLSCGLLVTISSGRAQWKAFLGLGLTLGLIYMTKFFLLPICLLILVVAWLIAKQRARYAIISAVAFVALAAPFIAALSAEKGRFTYGEAASYDYAVTVNGIPHYHWQGDRNMPLSHPTREILAAPAIYEFREPFKGTYPPEYDISYWYDGVKPQIHFRQQMRALATNLFFEFETVFYALNGVLLTTLFLTLYQTGRRFLILKDMLRYWFLIVPCVALAVVHALVYYHPRYLAASFAVLLLCLFSIADSTFALRKSRLPSGVAVLQFAMFFGFVGLPLLLHLFDVHPLHSRVVETASYQQVAEKAVEMGLRPGDQIASLNYSNEGMAMWAHLARIQIIAEVYNRPGQTGGGTVSYWNADPLTQERALQRLAQTGARAAVSQDTPTGEGAGGWLQIGKTGYYLFWLKPPE
jgi:hypothetical protein